MSGRIRLATLADASAIERIYAPYVTDRVTSFELVAPDTNEIERRLTALGDRYPWLVFEDDEQVLGYAYASAHAAREAYRWSVNVSVYVHPRAHRRGIGRALYLALFEILRRQQFVNAYGGITLPNPASEGLHLSIGFVPVGIYRQVGFKFGQWWDVVWMHLRLRDDQTPAEPRSYKAAVETAEIQELIGRLAETVRA